ncbi:hypothetical protein [Fischerella sp. PCC 9605]|uniref:hypothetical protein n=1 Tax=Fischerella sp. PCC 9605 TaxID=1173024 RepID=UPI0018CC092A|nr:hypothetical protein [Fischerella sp. PCC 9605]
MLVVGCWLLLGTITKQQTTNNKQHCCYEKNFAALVWFDRDFGFGLVVGIA